jgi:hypothetical protein
VLGMPAEIPPNQLPSSGGAVGGCRVHNAFQPFPRWELGADNRQPPAVATVRRSVSAPPSPLHWLVSSAEALHCTVRCGGERLRRTALRGGGGALAQVRSDVTRYRYGDEQHLDEALKRIFRLGQVRGPRPTRRAACGSDGVDTPVT